MATDRLSLAIGDCACGMRVAQREPVQFIICPECDNAIITLHRTVATLVLADSDASLPAP